MERVKRRIMKLLALSSSPNEHEARNALAKAQRLAFENKISISELDDCNDDNVIEVRVNDIRKKTPKIEREIAFVLSKHFRLKAYWSGYNGRVHLIGRESDIKIFAPIYKYTLNCYKNLKKHFIKYSKKELYSDDINTYNKGFCNGIGAELKKNEEQYALIVVPDDDVLKKYDKLSLIGGVDMSNYSGNTEIYNNGYTDGSSTQKKKQIGEKQ